MGRFLPPVGVSPGIQVYIHTYMHMVCHSMYAYAYRDIVHTYIREIALAVLSIGMDPHHQRSRRSDKMVPTRGGSGGEFITRGGQLTSSTDTRGFVWKEGSQLPSIVGLSPLPSIVAAPCRGKQALAGTYRPCDSLPVRKVPLPMAFGYVE
jgi:hypothetical protein